MIFSNFIENLTDLKNLISNDINILVKSDLLTENNFNVYRIYTFCITSQIVDYLLKKNEVKQVKLYLLIDDTVGYDGVNKYSKKKKNYKYIFSISIFLAFLKYFNKIKIKIEKVEDVDKRTGFIKFEDKIPEIYTDNSKLKISFIKVSSLLEKFLKVEVRKLNSPIAEFLTEQNEKIEEILDSNNLCFLKSFILDKDYIFQSLATLEHLLRTNNINCVILERGEAELYESYLKWIKAEHNYRFKQNVNFIKMKAYVFGEEKEWKYINPKSSTTHCFIPNPKGFFDLFTCEDILFNPNFNYHTDVKNKEIKDYLTDLISIDSIQKEILINFREIYEILRQIYPKYTKIIKYINNSNLFERELIISYEIPPGRFYEIKKAASGHNKHNVIIRYLKLIYDLLNSNPNLEERRFNEQFKEIYKGIEKYIKNNFVSDQIRNNLAKLFQEKFYEFKNFDNESLIEYSQKKTRAKEILQVVDNFGKPTGNFVERERAHEKKGIKHLSLQILVFNSKNELILHRRAESKLGGNALDIPTTHILKEETRDQAGKRCLRKEYGITIELDQIQLEGGFSYEYDFGDGTSENEYSVANIVIYDGEIIVDPEEIYEGPITKHIKEVIEEIHTNLDEYTLWFQELIKIFMNSSKSERFIG